MGEDDELTRRITAEAAALKLAERPEDDEDWIEDTSEAAVAARMKDLAVSGAVAKLMGEGEDGEGEGGEDDLLDFFTDFLSAPRTDAEIKDKLKEMGVRSDKALTILACTLLTDAVLAEKQIEAHTKLLATLVKNDKCQRALLGGIERLVGVQHPAVLLPKLPLILKALYDAELVEEEAFLTWADKPSKKYVDRKVSKELRAKAAPFISWLREADSDGSSGSEEESA
jgi:translation initiation factor 5